MHISEWRVVFGIIQEIRGNFQSHFASYWILWLETLMRWKYNHLAIQYYTHTIIMFIVYFIFLTNISQKICIFHFLFIFNSTSFTFRYIIRYIIRKICIKLQIRLFFSKMQQTRSLWLKTNVPWSIEKKMSRWKFTPKKPWKLRGLIWSH